MRNFDRRKRKEKLKAWTCPLAIAIVKMSRPIYRACGIEQKFLSLQTKRQKNSSKKKRKCKKKKETVMILLKR